MTSKLLLTILLLVNVSFIFGQNTSKTFLFVGTYTGGIPDSGIYVYEFNSHSGKLKKTFAGENLTNPSFLSISPNGQFLYACTDSKLPKHGNVTAFKIDTIAGKISYINKQSCGGENPVYLTVHKNNKFILNGNYNAGSVSAFTTNKDGSLNPYSQIIHFKDSSVNKNRQEKSHIHAAVFSPNNDYVFSTDLGADKIRVFSFDTLKTAPLLSVDSLLVATIPGCGPRHFTFHPNGKFSYCIEELSGTISVYSYKQGKLESLQRLFSYSKISETYSGADIHLSPDGLFLYASNRDNNENTISIFSVDQVNGKLKLVGHQSTFGKHPRNFVIDPTGNFLLVANVSTNNIVVFARNLKTGLLTKTEHEINIQRPSCLKMVSYKSN